MMRQPRRWRRIAGWFGGAAAALSLASQAIAAQPRSGCWGTCRGNSGPNAGTFQVNGRRVEHFLIAEKCLGYEKYTVAGGLPLIAVFELAIPSMAINRAGNFSFDGTTVRTYTFGKHKVRAKLTGRFTTPSTASVTLTIHFAHCGTKHIIIRSG